jgi:type II secretory pathway component GspD/PulD (secretin)
MVCGSAAAAELTLEIIGLQHTQASEILPLIEPLVDPGGTVTGMGDQLIIKATQANLAEIKLVVATFDRAPKTLRITVRQDVAAHSQITEDAVSGRYRTGDFSGRVPDPGTHDGASVGIRDRNGNAVRYRSINTRSAEDSRNTHFVTTIEGRPALIQTGKSIPYPYQSGYYDRYGAVINEGIEYRDLNSGFYVTPRTHGNQVTLDIAPQLEREDPSGRGVIDTRYASATVNGRLGEWIPLGGVNEADSGENSALLARTRHRGTEVYDVWVKVEEVP